MEAAAGGSPADLLVRQSSLIVAAALGADGGVSLGGPGVSSRGPPFLSRAELFRLCDAECCGAGARALVSRLVGVLDAFSAEVARRTAEPLAAGEDWQARAATAWLTVLRVLKQLQEVFSPLDSHFLHFTEAGSLRALLFDALRRRLAPVAPGRPLAVVAPALAHAVAATRTTVARMRAARLWAQPPEAAVRTCHLLLALGLVDDRFREALLADARDFYRAAGRRALAAGLRRFVAHFQDSMHGEAALLALCALGALRGAVQKVVVFSFLQYFKLALLGRAVDEKAGGGGFGGGGGGAGGGGGFADFPPIIGADGDGSDEALGLPEGGGGNPDSLLALLRSHVAGGGVGSSEAPPGPAEYEVGAPVTKSLGDRSPAVGAGATGLAPKTPPPPAAAPLPGAAAPPPGAAAPPGSPPLSVCSPSSAAPACPLVEIYRVACAFALLPHFAAVWKLCCMQLLRETIADCFAAGGAAGGAASGAAGAFVLAASPAAAAAELSQAASPAIALNLLHGPAVPEPSRSAGKAERGSPLPSSSPEELLARLRQLHGRLQLLLRTHADGDASLEEALEEACAAAVNESAAVARYATAALARAADAALRAGAAAADCWAELHQPLFRWILPKDFFELLYVRDLVRRLVRRTSPGEAAERRVIAVFRDECGPAYTAKMETVLQEMAESTDLAARFAESEGGGVEGGAGGSAAEGGGSSRGGGRAAAAPAASSKSAPLTPSPSRKRPLSSPAPLAFKCIVLSAAVWPFAEGAAGSGAAGAGGAAAAAGERRQPSVPDEVRCWQQAYEAFYKREAPRRTLRWDYSFGSAVVEATFPGASGAAPATYLMHASPVQACVLALFNSHDVLSAARVSALTGFEVQEALKALLALSCHEQRRVLVKAPSEKGEEAGAGAAAAGTAAAAADCEYCVNVHFSSPRTRLVFTTVTLRDGDGDRAEAAAEDRVRQDRSLALEAFIVRTMKAHKSLERAELLRRAAAEPHLLVALPQMADCIDRLVHREFIGRAEDATDTLMYIP